MTKMTEKVANGVLSGVLKVSGFFSSSVINSKAGKKLFGLLPGEMVLATLDGFSKLLRSFFMIMMIVLLELASSDNIFWMLFLIDKVCDAVEVAGRNVMKTSSTVTTEIVDHK